MVAHDQRQFEPGQRHADVRRQLAERYHGQIEGPNLYDLVINANITGGGTSGKFERQGVGGIRLNGINTNLTGTNETQTISVPNNVTKFVINFGGFAAM